MIRLLHLALYAVSVAFGITGCAPHLVPENRVFFRCPGGEAIEATFRDGEVAVTLPDGTKAVLPHAISASGARYCDGTTTLWNKGNTVFIMKGEDVVLEGCVAMVDR
jgi:membrane-bound inhibitor of C-type lysozyme